MPRRTSGIETGARRALKRSFRSSTSGRLSSWRRSWERLIELVVQGTLIGSLYALVALGFVLIYKASRVINFAQGELVMMGGYLGVAFTALYGVPWPLAFLLTIISAAVGVDRANGAAAVDRPPARLGGDGHHRTGGLHPGRAADHLGRRPWRFRRFCRAMARMILGVPVSQVIWRHSSSPSCS